jgi:hypothetical protein
MSDSPPPVSSLDVLSSLDVGPIVHNALDIKALLALIGTCTAVKKAVTFKVAKAHQAFQEHGSRLAAMAIQWDDLRLLQWTRLHGGAFGLGGGMGTYEMWFAASKGRLSLLRYMHSVGVPWHSESCNVAAECGHLDCLKFAHAHGCKWSHKTTENAARNGHANCLHYALENKCERSIAVFFFVCRFGHLECAKVAHQFRCPWSPDASSQAAMFGHAECLYFLLTKGYECAREALPAAQKHASDCVADLNTAKADKWAECVRLLERQRASRGW